MEGNRDQDVGYGRPPKATQFQKGQSGNPKGRPIKEEGSFWDEFLYEMARQFGIKNGGKTEKISARTALIRTLITKGLGGDITALRLLLNLNIRIPVDQGYMVPQIIIKPPAGPAPPTPPIYMGDDDKKDEA